MKNVSYVEFVGRYPARKPHSSIPSIWPGDLTIEEDTSVTGPVQGNVIVKSGARAITTGVVEGNILIEQSAVLFLSGVVQENMDLEGNACISGLVPGGFNAATDATVCASGAFQTN